MGLIRRTLPRALRKYLDTKVVGNPDILSTLETPSILFLECAKALLGTEEEGKNKGEIVSLLQKTVGDSQNEPWCFPGDVEILTKSGWQRFEEIDKEVEVVQVDEAGAISYAKPSSFIEKDYDGPGYHLKTQSLDIKCDAGHRFWGYFNNSKIPDFRNLGEVTTCLSIPQAYSSEKCSSFTDKELEFIAAFMSDGFFSKTKTGIPRIRIQVSRERKLLALRLLNPIGEHKASKAYGLSKVPLTTFLFNVPEYFSEIFDDYKSLNWDFIKSLSSEQARKFLYFYSTYDGSKKKGSFVLFSSNEDIVDKLIAIAVLAGHHPNVTVNFSKISGKPCWSITIAPKKKSRTIRSRDIKKITLKEKLYCVSVPQSRIIVRGYNKVPLVTGNCLSFIQACIAYVEEVAAVDSELVATEHVLTLWNASKKINRVDFPRRSDLILWRYGKTISGHIGVILEVLEDSYLTIEGNTSPAFELEREGDGVYVKRRSKGGMGQFSEIGFLRPFP